MRATPATSLQSDINVTPLIDVCLVLLIVFMVITPLLVTGMPVHLPQAANSGSLAKQPLNVTVNADGTIYLDTVAIRGEQLQAELARRHNELARPVVVRADKTLAYGEVVRVLDSCRAAGFHEVGLATERATLSKDSQRER